MTFYKKQSNGRRMAVESKLKRSCKHRAKNPARLIAGCCLFQFRSQMRKAVPSWSLRGRSDVGGVNYHNTKAGTPGPASYEPVKTSVYKRQSSAGFTMQTRHNQKDYSTIKDNPGPGCYDTRDIGTTSATRRGLTMGIPPRSGPSALPA